MSNNQQLRSVSANFNSLSQICLNENVTQPSEDQIQKIRELNVRLWITFMLRLLLALSYAAPIIFGLILPQNILIITICAHWFFLVSLALAVSVHLHHVIQDPKNYLKQRGANPGQQKSFVLQISGNLARLALFIATFIFALIR